jgi:AcrR family transcriptional regulator
MARPKSDIEPRVVHAARERFLAEGVDGASLRTIAAEAGTSIGMVYYYFPTKDDLFLAVVEEIYAGILRDLEEATKKDAPADVRLRRALTRLGRMSETELKVVRLIVREALVSSSRFERVLARFQRGHLPLVLGILVDGVAEGTIEPSLPLPILFLATLGMGVVPQIVRRLVGERAMFVGLPEAGDLAGTMIDLLLHGIGPKPNAKSEPAPTAKKKAQGPRKT